MSRVSTINTIFIKIACLKTWVFWVWPNVPYFVFFPRKWIMIFLMPTKSALYKAAVVQIVSLPYLLILRTDQEHCKNCTVIFCINLYLFPFFKRLQIKNDLCYNWYGCNVNNHRHFYEVMYQSAYKIDYVNIRLISIKVNSAKTEGLLESSVI